MVDHQIDGDERIRLLRIGAQLGEGVAHGGQVHHAGDAGEVLQQHAGGTEVDLLRGRGGVPLCDVLDVGAFNGEAVLEAQQVFEQNLDRIRDARELGYSSLFERSERIDAVGTSGRLE